MESNAALSSRKANWSQVNLQRRMLAYPAVLAGLAGLLCTPVLNHYALHAAAAVGVLVLWVTISDALGRAVVPGPTLASDGKAVLITGCDSGFGHRLALQLDKLGYQVFAGCLFPTGSGAQQLRSSASVRLHVIGLDVTKEEDFKRAFDYVGSNLSSGSVLWAVVANAGVLQLQEFEWFTSEEVARLLDVNVMGATRLVGTFLPLVRAARGRVLLVSSYGGRMAPGWHSIYSMSKYALIGFAESLRKEMRKFDVEVVTIEPFYYRTALLPHAATINKQFSSLDKPQVKAVYTEAFARDEACSQIGFMNKLARSDPDEVVTTMVGQTHFKDNF